MKITEVRSCVVSKVFLSHERNFCRDEITPNSTQNLPFFFLFPLRLLGGRVRFPRPEARDHGRPVATDQLMTFWVCPWDLW